MLSDDALVSALQTNARSASISSYVRPLKDLEESEDHASGWRQLLQRQSRLKVHTGSST